MFQSIGRALNARYGRSKKERKQRKRREARKMLLEALEARHLLTGITASATFSHDYLTEGIDH
jgi:hypothetical protein